MDFQIRKTGDIGCDIYQDVYDIMFKLPDDQRRKIAIIDVCDEHIKRVYDMAYHDGYEDARDEFEPEWIDDTEEVQTQED